MTGKKRFISLRVKMTLGVILICFVIGMLSILWMVPMENGYVVMAALLIAGMTILLLVISLLYVSRNVIDPVKKLSETAENYCSENNNVVHHAFEKL